MSASRCRLPLAILRQGGGRSEAVPAGVATASPKPLGKRKIVGQTGSARGLQ